MGTMPVYWQSCKLVIYGYLGHFDVEKEFHISIISVGLKLHMYCFMELFSTMWHVMQNIQIGFKCIQFLNTFCNIN